MQLARTLRYFALLKFLPKSHVLPPQVHADSTSADTDTSKAELFNQYFYSVFTHSDFPMPDPMDMHVPVDSLNLINFTEQEVFDALINLNPNKASGIDNIAPVVLKNCAHALTISAHHLFTISIKSGSIPSEWKIHKITSVYKSGNKTSVTNYRPISLLCMMSKVLERLI